MDDTDFDGGRYSTAIVRQWVLARLEKHGTELSFAPGKILQALCDEEGTGAAVYLLEALLSLIWEGKLVVTGPWRVRLPAPHEVKVKPPELVRLEEAREALVAQAKAWLTLKDRLSPQDAKLADAITEMEAAEEAVKGKNG